MGDARIINGSVGRSGQQDAAHCVSLVLLPQLVRVPPDLVGVVGRRRSHLVLDGDQTLLSFEQDRDVDVVPLPPDGDIRCLGAGFGKTRLIPRCELPIDVVHEPFQETCADTVSVGGPKQAGQCVAVAYLVIRVPENVERVELSWFQEFPMVGPKPTVIDQPTQVELQGFPFLSVEASSPDTQVSRLSIARPTASTVLLCLSYSATPKTFGP